MPADEKLLDFIRGTMEVIVELSEEDCKERAVTICKDDLGKFFIPDICVGSECRVETPTDCKGGTSVADLHTHPCPENVYSSDLSIGVMQERSLTPSFEDLISWLARSKDIDYACIGNRLGAVCYDITPEEWEKTGKANIGEFLDQLLQKRVWLKG